VHSPSHKAPVNSSSGSCAVADLLDLASELETIQNAADQLDTHMASFAPFSVDQNQQAALPQPGNQFVLWWKYIRSFRCVCESVRLTVTPISILGEYYDHAIDGKFFVIGRRHHGQ
jgi:hypothetical protein